MRRVAVSTLTPGAMLGRTLYNERGDQLLKKGAVLTDRYIDILREKGYLFVHVVDEDTADIDVEDIVSEHVRATATKSIYRFLEVIDRAAEDLRDENPDDLAAALGSPGFRRLARAETVCEQLYGVVESIIDEVLDAPVLTGVSAIKTHDNYTFCHSVDVTITAIMIGKRFYFDRAALRQLALGCIMHDAGKIFIDLAILNKPGKLEPEEYELIKQHPTLGYQLLKSIQKDEFLANYVAYQHHERQDGLGYPRSLRGTNRISRDRLAGDGRMLFIAEIAAVADVYDALGSDRPYRAGMPPDRIVQTLRGMTGTHLNREILNHFLTILPVFPVGIDVQVRFGRYRGYRGIVARLNQRAMDRPIVRLLYDDRHRRIKPIEVDLLKERDVQIAAILDREEPGLPQSRYATA